MRKKTINLLLLLASILGSAVPYLQAQDTCPPGACGTGVSPGLNIFFADGRTLVGGQSLAPCETIILQMTVAWRDFDPNPNCPGFPASFDAAFFGGALKIFGGSLPAAGVDVTPPGGIPVIGDPNQAAPCPPAVRAVASVAFPYTITAADAAAGTINFLGVYTNGSSIFPGATPGQTAGQSPLGVTIAPCPGPGPCQAVICDPARTNIIAQGPPIRFRVGQCVTNALNPPTCVINPSRATLCTGLSTNFTVTITPNDGTAPIVISWTKNGAAFDGSSATITAVAPAAGVTDTYVAQIVSANGCTNTCTATITGSPALSCVVSPQSASLCPGLTTNFTVVITGGTAPFTTSWTKNGVAFNGSSTTITATAPATGVTDTYSAHIVDSAGCTTDCSATLLGLACNPKICVEKVVACAPSSGVCDNSLPYGESATGVSGAAFCYKITVENCGQEQLNSVALTDPDLGGALAGFPTSLAIGEKATNFFKKTWPAVNVGDADAVHINTVTANGVGATSQIRTNDTDTANAVVVPVGVECSILLFSSFDEDNNANDNHVTLPDNGTVQFSLTIRNTGRADLSVAIAGAPCATVPATVPIPAGGSTNFVCDVDVTCPAGTNITVTVTGTAVASASVPCVFDTNGRAITTGPSPCSASVTCERPVECRVTGGGTLIAGTVDDSCIDVTTTIFPLTLTNGLTINKITHGGQLGAPFSQQDCGEVLGNRCIRGQWQHTRHYQGKAHPRDVIDMDFHSVTPKGQFDSLNCACLGCCDPTTGVFITPITVGEICNPDDHKVCGPQPRPAPANAIIFSGVGRFTPTTDTGSNQKAAEWVVFRVYIEDRSEPGGFHPRGAVEPADIYCFQAWKTGILVSRRPNFDVVEPDFRHALGQANCDFLAALQSGALPIGSLPPPTVNDRTADIQDCGPLHDGNHQIHPATGAECDQP